MDNAHPLSTLIVVYSLDAKKDPFRPLKEDEEILVLKVPYLSAIGALMYLVNCTRLNIVFVVNLLARYSSTPTKKHWNRIKHILRYLHRKTKIELFYSGSNSKLIGHADAGYLSDPHKKRLQTGYLFTYRDTVIFWRYIK